MYVNSTLNIIFTLGGVFVPLILLTGEYIAGRKVADETMLNMICNPSFLFELWITEQLTLS